jgi:uncharacterized membrane protein
MVAAGPLEVLVMGFAGEGLPDGVGAALEQIQASGDVRIVEAFLVMKAGSAAVRVEEVTDLMGLAGTGSPFGGALPEASLWKDPESVREVGRAMPPDSTALALVLVHQAARDVVTAFRDLGGVVLTSTRLPT